MHRNSTWVVLAVAALALLLVPVAAIGTSGTFGDVPDGHTFKADIEWLATVGVTKGCNPPANTEFCPEDPVTRGQMAAFIHRLSNGVVDAKTALTAESAATAESATSALSADELDGMSPSVLRDWLLGSRLDVPAAAFTPRSAETVDYTNNGWGALFLDAASPQSEAQFVAPVVLPDGAEVTAIRALVIDNELGNFVDVVMSGISKTNGVFYVVGGVDGSGHDSPTPTTLSSDSITNPVIDADQYWYNLGASIRPGTGLYGVVIEYTIP